MLPELSRERKSSRSTGVAADAMDADNKVLAATAAEAKVALSVSAESRDFMMKFRWEWTREKL